MIYKLSNYNVLTESKYGFLLYNQISGCLLHLSDEQLNYYNYISNRKFLIKNIFSKNLRFFNFLIEGMFIVNINFNELVWMDEVFNRKSNKFNYKQLTIAPTDRCNLDCDYCYEAKDQWILMSDDTINKLKKFIDEFVTYTKTTNLDICWFGGEPTLHMGCIKEITNHIRNLAKNNNFIIKQSMITNGTTLNKKMRDDLIKLQITDLQITVDGNKEQHDINRPFRKSKNLLNIIQNNNSCGGCSSGGASHTKSSYEKIMEYLPDLYEEGFQISLRVNVNHENYESFKDIKEQLKKYNNYNKKGGMIIPYASPIVDHKGNNSNLLPREKFSRELDVSKLDSFTGNSCMASQRYSLGISQTGKISNCWEHITNESHIVGSIENLELARIGSMDDYSPINDPDCSSCHVLPTCWGGCRAHNKFYEKGYYEKNYFGCSFAKYNIKDKVIKLYESKIKC